MRGVKRLLMTTEAVGGVWRYAVDLARGLREPGVETTLLGFGPRPDPAQRAEAESVAALDWCDLPLDWMVEDAGALAAVPEAIARHAAGAGADLVQVNLPSQAAGLAAGVPVVVAAHSCVASWFQAVRATAPPPAWAWQGRLTGQGLATADRVVAPSRAFARVLAETYPGLGPVSVVPNATKVVRGPEARQPFAYAAARWWDAGKGADVLDAAAALARWPIHAAGATRGPGAESVVFRHARALGQLDRERLLALGASAALFVSPSRYEPFGLAALEAAALGAALVLSDIPTYRELWEGAALFADPRDPAAFAAALDRLSRDDALRTALAREGIARAATHSPAVQAARMHELYRGLVPAVEPVGAA